MNTSLSNIVKASIIGTLISISTATFANDKVETVYNAKQFQNVCKGKSEGAEVSFPYRGIIWNGTCQLQFFSSNNKEVGEQANQLNSACRNDPKQKSINIEGTAYSGKCALGYAPPAPKQ